MLRVGAHTEAVQSASIALERESTALQHLKRQGRGRVVQHDDVEPIGGDASREGFDRSAQPCASVAARGSGVEEKRDVDIAICAWPPGRLGAK